MKKNRILLTIIFLFIFTGSLFLINKDLLHFSYTFPYSRKFTPEENTKGNYLVTDPIPLKRGEYQMSISGFAEGIGNGCYLLDSNNTTVYSTDIPAGEVKVPYFFELNSNTSVRIGFAYDPEYGSLEINKIQLQSDHILYKESVIRHFIFSFITVIIFAYIGLRILKPDFAENIKAKTGFDLVASEKIFLFLFLLTLLASWPLFDLSRFTEGDDFFFHLSRIEGMAASLKAGYFPTRILLGWMENYGVGSGFYYPDLFMLIPAGLHAVGISSIDAMRIFLILCTFFSNLTVYLAAKNICRGSSISGSIAAALYAFAAYRLTCVFYRNALGEVQSFIFYPLILWGLIEILRGNVGKWYLFAMGFFGLLMSHMISLAISGVLCALCLLFFIPRLIKNKRILFALIKSAAVTILLGAFFLMPMAEQAAKNELEINVFLKQPFEITIVNLMTFNSIIYPFSPWDHIHNIANIYPGYALLAVPLMRLIFLGKKGKDEQIKTADRIMIPGLLLLIVGTNLFPWQFFIFKWFLGKIQFTWRLYGAATVLLCIAGGIYFERIYSESSHKKQALILMLGVAILSGFPILIHTWNTKLYPVERFTLSDKIINGVEYVPHDFFYPFQVSNRNKVLTDESQVEITDGRRQKLGYFFSYTRSTEGPLNYSLPLIYYYGYKAQITDENGSVREIPVSRDAMGLLQVSDEGVPKGTIHTFYAKTTVQRISEGISLCTLFVLLFFACKDKKTRNINKK